jgi:hypothetical protein
MVRDLHDPIHDLGLLRWDDRLLLAAPNSAASSYSGLGSHLVLLEKFKCVSASLFICRCHADLERLHPAKSLGAPDCGASFDFRLGPHWRCLLAF